MTLSTTEFSLLGMFIMKCLTVPPESRSTEELKKVKIKLEKDDDDYYEDDGGKYEDDDIVEGEEAEEKGRKVEKI